MTWPIGLWFRFRNTLCLASHTLWASIQGGKTKTGIRLYFQKWLVPDSDSTSLAKRPYFDNESECNQYCSESSGRGSDSSENSKKKGGHWKLYSWCVAVWYFISISLLHQFWGLVLFPQFLDDEKSITSNMFVVNMVNGYHFHPRYDLPLFHNSKSFKHQSCFNLLSSCLERSWQVFSQGCHQSTYRYGKLFSSVICLFPYSYFKCHHHFCILFEKKKTLSVKGFGIWAGHSS